MILPRRLDTIRRAMASPMHGRRRMRAQRRDEVERCGFTGLMQSARTHDENY